MKPGNESRFFPYASIVVLLLATASACQGRTLVKMHEPFRVGDLRFSIESAKIERRPPRIVGPRARPDRTYLIVYYRLVNQGKTSVDVGLPPFELRTADGHRFAPDLLVSLLHPAERAEQSGSLGAMADVLNTELHPGLSATYEVAFALPPDAANQRLYLTVRRGWLGHDDVTVSLSG